MIDDQLPILIPPGAPPYPAASNMTRAEYEAAVCARVKESVRVPFRQVALADWSPKNADCHQNAAVWVRANPEFQIVRGWVIYASFGGDSVGLTAHSVVRNPSGAIIDITPLENEDNRAGMRFVEHEGDPAVFDEIKAADIYIHCLDFGAPDQTEEPFQEFLDGMSEEE